MNRYLIIMGLLLGCVDLHAQDTTAQEKGLSVRLLAFAPLKGADSVVIQSGKVLSDEMVVPTHGLGLPIPVNSRELTLGLLPKEDGQPIRVLAKIKLPPQGKKFLLLLIPDDKGYECRPVRLDAENFRGGDTLCYNAGSVSIGGTLGKTKFAVMPRKFRIMSSPKANDKPYYQVKFYYNNKGESRIFSDTRWPYDNRLRSYIFFYSNPKTSKVTYRAVDETVPENK